MRAVVVGGGIAGLLAAKALLRSGREVLLLEKDAGSPGPRSGVPQGAHLHVLLKRGQELLEELFPGILAGLEAAGAPRINWALDTLWERRVGAFPRYRSAIETLSFTRPFLEEAVRARIAREDGIAFRREQVVGIGEGGRSLTLLGGGELHADLLVLAGGAGFSLRSLCAPAELAACTERHRVGLTYRSVLLEGEAFAGESFRQYYYQLSPPGEAMGGVICPVEGGRAVATIVEHGAEERGRADYRAFLAKAALIPGGRFRALLERARPLGEPAVFHKEETFRRRLHELPGFPERVFCVGDIVGSLNPVYGQGMTMALLGASLLEQALRSGATSSRAFHRRLSARLRVPFLLSRVGFAEGPGQRYLQSFLSRCVRSERRHARFLEVMHLRRSPLLLADLPSALAALPGRLS